MSSEDAALVKAVEEWWGKHEKRKELQRQIRELDLTLAKSAVVEKLEVDGDEDVTFRVANTGITITVRAAGEPVESTVVRRKPMRISIKRKR